MSDIDAETEALRRSGLWLALLVLVALIVIAAGFVVSYLIVGHGGDDVPEAVRAPARSVSAEELRDLAGESPLPIYWAGPREGYTYEFTQTTDGRVYIRYLPDGIAVGDPRPGFLTVGTYPVEDALSVVDAASQVDGAERLELPRDGVGVVDERQPASAYFAFGDADVQVEVYDPVPRAARTLVAEGEIVPVDAG